MLVTLLESYLLLLIFYPTKIKVAKRLDKEFNLNQKVQTMIEFNDSDTLMSKIQREDTLNILGKTELKKLTMSVSVFLLFFAIVTLFYMQASAVSLLQIRLLQAGIRLC